MPIDRLRLSHYKGFEEFTLYLRPGTTLLVGPNNAGKSTIISALRLCATLLNQAKRRKSDEPLHDVTRDRRVRGDYITLPSGQFVDENVRHEFREIEARLELRFKNKAALHVVWPVEDRPFFYLEHIEGMQPRTVRIVKDFYSSIGVVPTLGPIEHRETMLSTQHVKDNLATRLVSRHFRNQLYFAREESEASFDRLREFILDNTPEIDGLDLIASSFGVPRELDLFFQEASTRTEKELYWAGDGLQIWLQVLFHIWRQSSSVSSLILDEPDVFLHPDLQRRLVRVLEELKSCQVILATHAPEMLAEASRESVVIVDRTRRKSRRVNDDRVLGDLNDVLGSGFNLRLARALQSRVALFVEGKDMKILRNIAKSVGAELFSQERGLTVAPMQGASNRQLASSFGWLNEHLLDNAVKVAVFLDRDYMTPEMCHDIVNECKQVGVWVHIWARKELESYLLIPSVIARVSGAPEAEVEKYLNEAADALRASIFARFLGVRTQAERGAARNEVSISEDYLPLFEEQWKDTSWRLHAAPAKDIISSVNQRIQDSGWKAVSARSLSARIRSYEVPVEMRDILLEIETMLSSPIK